MPRNEVWYGRRMEELTPKPRRKDGFRVWVKPAFFTTILYAGLLGGYFLYKKTSNQSVALPSDRSQDLTALNVKTVNEQTDNQDKSAQQVILAPASVAKTAVNVPSNAPIVSVATERNIQHSVERSITQHHLPPPEPALQESISVVLSQKNDLAQTHKNSKEESAALTKAEAEAEAQNELLREAIHKVRTLNENKIAKAHESEMESGDIKHSLPANQDKTKAVQKEEEQTPIPPKIDKQPDKVVIQQESSNQTDIAGDVE